MGKNMAINMLVSMARAKDQHFHLVLLLRRVFKIIVTFSATKGFVIF